jgi:hypothetical protein
MTLKAKAMATKPVAAVTMKAVAPILKQATLVSLIETKWKISSSDDMKIPYCRSLSMSVIRPNVIIVDHGEWQVISVRGSRTAVQTLSFEAIPSVAYVCFRKVQWCKIVYRFHCILSPFGCVTLDRLRAWDVSIPTIQPIAAELGGLTMSQTSCIQFSNKRRIWHPPIDRGKPRSFDPFLNFIGRLVRSPHPFERKQQEEKEESRRYLGRLFVLETNEKTIVRVIGCVSPLPKPFDTRKYVLPPTRVMIEYLSPKDVWTHDEKLNHEWLKRTCPTHSQKPAVWSIYASWVEKTEGVEEENVCLRLGRQTFVPLIVQSAR